MAETGKVIIEVGRDLRSEEITPASRVPRIRRAGYAPAGASDELECLRRGNSQHERGNKALVMKRGYRTAAWVK